MKIRTWIKYEEPYLPSRCRKLRYRGREEYVNINLKEVDPADFHLAFVDNSYSGKGKIYFYKGKLWVKMPMTDIIIYDKSLGRDVRKNVTALERLIWKNENCSTYFRFDFDRTHYNTNTSREAVIKQARADIHQYIFVDGELYEQTAEPRYRITTFGLGYNHGGTGLFVTYDYNPNISKECYFSALQGDEAVAYANLVATRRGDTNDVGKFEKMIEVHMPELVKVKPNKQHGDGNKLLKDFEQIIQNSNSTFEAGLLCMATAMLCL